MFADDDEQDCEMVWERYDFSRDCFYRLPGNTLEL